MRNLIVISVTTLLFAGCKETKKEQIVDKEVSTETISTEKKVFERTQNYAVVFNWVTEDEKLVRKNSMLQADQLRELWNNGIVENIYYDAKPQYDRFSDFPNITFTLKAASKETASTILNELIVVKKGIANYKTFPIGTLWLKRNKEAIEKRGKTHSYVAIWTTDYRPEDTMVEGQNQVLKGLWNEGKIENVYFDMEGTQKGNNKTDFVFYVNANSEEEAKAIIDPLPFVRNAVASYKLHPVGIFWMGIAE